MTNYPIARRNPRQPEVEALLKSGISYAKKGDIDLVLSLFSKAVEEYESISAMELTWRNEVNTLIAKSWKEALYEIASYASLIRSRHKRVLVDMKNDIGMSSRRAKQHLKSIYLQEQGEEYCVYGRAKQLRSFCKSVKGLGVREGLQKGRDCFLGGLSLVNFGSF